MFTISNILKRGANYLLMVLLARSISLNLMGTFSAYLNIITTLLLITNFGFSEYLLVNSENPKQRDKNTSNFLQISLVLFLIIVFVGLCLSSFDTNLILLILLKVYLETSLYNILLSYYQVKNNIRVMTVTNVVSGILVIVVCLLSYFFNQSIYIYLIGVNVIYIVVFLFHFIKIKFKFVSLVDMWVYIKTRFSSLKYYGITTMTIPVYMMAPTVIGSFILPPDVLAQYQVAFSIANILLLVSVSLLQVGYAKFIECQNNFSELTKALKSTALKIMGVNIIFLVFFVIFGEQVLLLIYKKQEYAQAYYPLLFLLLGNTIFMFASISAVIMVVLKLQKEKAGYHIEFIIVSIFFGFTLTYYFGIYGLVWSYIILYSYSTFRYVKKYIKIYNLKHEKDLNAEEIN